MVEQVLKERYAIQKQLGRNAGRRTLLARDLQTQELVALKLLAFTADFQWDDFKLFEREAETLQSLSHPAIPRYLDHFEFQTAKTKGFVLVQSYIEAKSLAEWVESGRSFNEEEIRQIAKSLLDILTYLHQQSPPVIHRDIKPSNILLGDRSGNSIGQVYLVDFGSVQTLAAREGSTITVVGTYGYMPPEQFGGRAVPESDLYSLGATLIYLVTETHPADLPQKDLRIQFQPKIALSSDYLGSDFVEWLKRMTEPNLKSRLSSAEEALKALEQPDRRERIPTVARKPAGSKVQLKKDKNTLEIKIPAVFWTGNLLWNFIVALFKLLLTMWVTVIIVGFSMRILLFWAKIIGFNVELLSYSLYTWIMIFITLYVDLILVLFSLQSTKLRIDRQIISLTYEWSGAVRYQAQPSSPKRTICKLSFTRHFGKGSNVRSNIQIWAGTREYKLPTEHLRNSEIDWIAQELSEWLDLPIAN